MRITLLTLMAAFIVLPIEAGSVVVQRAVVHAVPLARVLSACGPDGEFDACTRFVAYRLEAQCAGTRMNASVTFRPVVFLYKVDRLTHEQMHVDDIRAYAAQYALELEAMAFDSESQCSDAARVAIGGFGEKMREFARRSMEHIH